jgi:digeranylgeranylglycerophospholipid reductase
LYSLNQLEDSYDVIVVGAGPAGSMAAWQAARADIKVLLLEKDREVGTPVRCAEGVAKRQLEMLIEESIPAGWIAAEINKFRLVAPDGSPVFVNVDEIGLVLHRRLVDYDLALKAVDAGAKLLTGAEVFDVIKNDSEVSGVKVKLEATTLDIHSRIVIAADGVESRVARWAGIDSTLKVKDIETCAQYTLANIKIDLDTCDFYFSREFSPGGYAWVFPKGKNTANVGLGISGNYAKHKTPEEYLDIFLEKYFPTASIVSKTIGGVPADKTLKDIVADRFMIVGDAAHQSNPISGGGILSGMIAGKLAGGIAREAVKKNKTKKNDLLPYAHQWRKKVGKSHERYYRLKDALTKFKDEQINYIAAEYLALPAKKKNLLNLYKIAFKNNPGFLLDVVKLFASSG